MKVRVTVNYEMLATIKYNVVPGRQPRITLALRAVTGPLNRVP